MMKAISLRSLLVLTCLLTAFVAKSEGWVVSEGKGECTTFTFIKDENNQITGADVSTGPCDLPAGAWHFALAVGNVTTPTPTSGKGHSPLPKRDIRYMASMDYLRHGANPVSSKVSTVKAFALTVKKGFDASKTNPVIYIIVPKNYPLLKQQGQG